MSGYQNEKQRKEELAKARLIIRVIEARGVKAADFGGTSDPFAELRIKNESHVLQTRVIKKTLNPMWNEEFILYPSNPDKDILCIKVYDFDSVGNNDLLGEIEIPVVALENRPPQEQWHQLQEKKGPTTFKPVAGEVKLVITYIRGGMQTTQPMVYPQQQMVYPQQQMGYPQQMVYPQQPMVYPQQPMVYPQQPMVYPQQPMVYPQQPYPYPQQYPQQYPPPPQ